MDLQLFYRDTEQADTWMAKQEAFLANEDLGDSLDSVEALIKKHEDFEKSLAAQEEKIKALDEFATKLIDGEHYAADDVAQRRAMVSFLHISFSLSNSICVSSFWNAAKLSKKSLVYAENSYKMPIDFSNLNAIVTKPRVG